MNLTNHLTEGNIKEQLIALAIPLIIGNILQQFYNTIDCYIVGHFINSSAFAALGVAGSLMNLFIFILNGSCQGVSLIFAQLYGQQNWKDIKKEAFLSIAFGLVFSLCLTLFGLLFLDTLLTLMKTPLEIKKYVVDYLHMIILCLIVTYFYNWCASILRAVGDSKASLYILIIALILNIFLDLLFVVGFKQGVTGAALATGIAQLFSSFACLFYIQRKYPYLLFSKREMIFDKNLFIKTVNFGFVSALHQSSLYIGKLLVQGTVNSAGIDVITAYTLTMRIEALINAFGDSGCVALSIFVGQNLGAQNKLRIQQSLTIALKLMLKLCISLSIMMVILTKPMIFLFIIQPTHQVIHHTFMYIMIIAIFYIFCFIGNCFVGLYRGLGMVNIPVIGTVLHISIRVILSAYLIHILELSAVALATGIGWVCVVIFQYSVYRKKVKPTYLH